MSKLANPEEVLREVIWYGAHRYDDKPSSFWNRMRIAAEALGDAEAASTFDDYCENGCPITNEHAQAAHILDALRKPSEAVVTAVCIAEDWQDFDAVANIISAAVAAAEREVGGSDADASAGVMRMRARVRARRIRTKVRGALVSGDAAPARQGRGTSAAGTRAYHGSSAAHVRH